MLRNNTVLIYGFAIFAMFFGSGNLVFPMQIGYVSGSHWFIGYIGLFLTGILLPFLGLFVIKLYGGNYHSFFGQAGKTAQTALPFLILSLLGCFGVVPRCITVAYGGLQFLMPQISLFVFSLVFCLIVFFTCLKEHMMLKILGKWMSPILLLSLVVLIISGIIHAPDRQVTQTMGRVFSQGFITGYQTMDLFAAFFFSALIFSQIQAAEPDKDDKSILIAAIKPSIFGATLLAIIYMGFVFLGASYWPLLDNVAPELMLPTIASHTVGNAASLIIAIAIIFSCISTAVALTNIYAKYLVTHTKIANQHFIPVLLITILITFIISQFNFSGIANFLVPILKSAYPGLIVLTVLGIVTKGQLTLKTVLFYGVTIVAAILI